MSDAMDPYLDYLKANLEKLKSKGTVKERQNALAEYNRALTFARRKAMTIRYALTTE